jgi:hypothetical protein
MSFDVEHIIFNSIAQGLPFFLLELTKKIFYFITSLYCLREISYASLIAERELRRRGQEEAKVLLLS